jgi:hypothetical protein
MNCLINNLVKQFAGKGKSAEVISRYLKMKYNISIDAKSLLRRQESVLKYNLSNSH